MAETKKRLSWVDVARGYGILAILMSHIMTGHPLSKWLFTFHVPLFFFLSGYVFRDGKDWKPFLLGKCRRLLVPYFAMGLCILIPETLLQTGAEDFWQTLGSLTLGFLIQRRQWTLWFLLALFFVELAGYWLIRLIRKKWLLAVTGLLLGAVGLGFFGVILPWCLDVVLPMLPFFLAGYLLKESRLDWQCFSRSKKGVAAFFLLGAGNLAMGAPAILGKLPLLDVFSGSYGFVPLSYPAAFCGILCVMLVACWWQPGVLQYLGRESMLYFAWHQTPVLTAILLFFPRLGIPVSGLSGFRMLGEKLLELAVILLLLTVVNHFVSRSKCKWILGK